MTDAAQVGKGPTGSWIVRVGWLLLAVLTVLLLCSAWQGPDIYYHLFLGKRVLETGEFQPADTLLIQQPQYVNVYWLFQILAYGFHSAGGVVGVTILMILAWLATLWLWIRTGRLDRSPAVGIPLALVSLLVIQNRFDPRPEVFSYLLLMIQIYWLSTWDFAKGLSWKKAVAFSLSQAIWTNMHGYFVLGPALVGLRLFSGLFHGEERPAVTAQLRLLGLVVLASMVSPFGPKGWSFAYSLWTFLRSMRDLIIETRPPVGAALRLWTIKLFWVVWGATIIAGLIPTIRRRGRFFPVVLGGAGLYLGATNARNIPLMILMTAPLWAMLIESFRTDRKGMRTVGTIATGIGGFMALLFCVSIITGGFHRSLTSATVFGVRLLPHAYPFRFVEWLRSSQFSGTIMNDSRDGGYLELHAPQLRLYIDSRYIEAQPVRTYFGSLRDPAVFLREHAKHNFDGALLSLSDSPRVIGTLLSKHGWRLAYADPHRAFLVAPSSPTAERLSEPTLRFYQGDDLMIPMNGRCAIEWSVLFVNIKEPELLREALRQLNAAPRVPSVVVQYGLGFGLERGDRGLVDLARSMAPRMIAMTSRDRQIVDTLLRQAAGRMP